MAVLTIIDGVLRIDNGVLVLSESAESPCCCAAGCVGCAGFSGSSALSASGALMAGTCVPAHVDTPFTSCCCGSSNFMDILDAGEYPDASAFFPNAINGSFDSVAIKDGYVACFFSEQDFGGSRFVVAKGPIVINNSNWRGDLRSGPAPGYRMAWSSTNMYSDTRWSNPGSLIICEYDGSTEIPETGFVED